MKLIKIKDIIAEKISGEWGGEVIDGKGVVVIRTANFLNSGQINFSNLVRREIDQKKVKKKRLISGDIIIEKSGGSPTQPVGRVVIFRNPDNDIYLCNNFTSILRPKKNEVHPEYLFYVLHNNHKKGKTLRHQNKTTGIINLKLDSYLDSEISLPPLDDQIRIAHLLGKVEKLIAQRKQHLQQLDDLLKSVFLEMFGDPVRNEKGWESHPLGSISNVQGGLQVTPKRNDYELDAPYLRVANVYRDRLNLREIKRIGLTPAELDRVRLQTGDLLIVEGHGNPEEVGRSSVWDGSIENCVHQNHLIRVRVDSSKITSIYASFFINSPGGRQQMFRSGKTTSGLNTISSKNVKDTMVAIPPLRFQNQFSVIAKKVDDIKCRYQQNLTDLEALYGALSQQAFKGELDLSRVPLTNKQSLQIRNEHDQQQEQGYPSPLLVNAITPTEVVNHLVQAAPPQGRSELLAHWLKQYLTNTLSDASLGSAQLLESAWQTLQENQLETEGETPALTLNDYDDLKDLVFKKLASGELCQAFDGDKNRVALQKRSANWGAW